MQKLASITDPKIDGLNQFHQMSEMCNKFIYIINAGFQENDIQIVKEYKIENIHSIEIK